MNANKTKTCVVMVFLAIPLPVLVYITFFYNPRISVTLPMYVRIDLRLHAGFNTNMTNINVLIDLLEDNAFTFYENLTFNRRPHALILGSWTTQEYSSGQTIQLSVHKNGSAWGIIQNFTLPRLGLRCMESPHRFNETRKFVVKYFRLELDPTQAEPRLLTPAGFCPHHGLYTNRVTFFKVETERYPLTGEEAIYRFFVFVLGIYGVIFLYGVPLFSIKMLEDKSLYPPSRPRLDVETQTKYPRDLFARYAEQYPHNPEGVLEWHIHKKMKEGKTREQATKELENTENRSI